MIEFIYFPCNGNKDLGKALLNRAIELNYKEEATLEVITRNALSLDIESRTIRWTNLPANDLNHELGDLNAFFHTDKYKVKRILY